MEATERAALERLVKIAQGETGQCKRIADFLLAWWNSDECGSFDFRSAWACDREICDDLATVFRYIVHSSEYPDSSKVGMGPVFAELVKKWRPNLVKA